MTIARVKALKVAQAKYGMTNVSSSDDCIFFRNNKVFFKVIKLVCSDHKRGAMTICRQVGFK